MARGLEPHGVKFLVPDHARTGSDTPSYMCGHGKKTTLDIILLFKYSELIFGLGQEPLTGAIVNAELFIMQSI